MHIPRLISLLPLSILTATAAALPNPLLLSPLSLLAHHQASKLERADATSIQAWKRTDSTGAEEKPSILVCEHVFWGGKCDVKTYDFGTDQCVVLDGTASSVRPAAGLTCVFYKNAVCRDFNAGRDSLTLECPGSDNLLATANGDFNDQIRAFQCYKKD